MPGSSYFPRTDAQLVAWAKTFASVLSASPAVYGATPETAASFQAVADALDAAYKTSQEPATRTRGTIAAKDAHCQAMKQAARTIVQVINAQPLADQQLIDIGLRPRHRQSAAAPVPPLAPMIEVLSVFGRDVRIRLRDATGESRGKPRLVTAAHLYSFVGDTPPAGADGWKSEGCPTRTKVLVRFPASVPAGAKVYLTAAWMNSRNQPGPACTPILTSIGYEGAMPISG